MQPSGSNQPKTLPVVTRHASGWVAVVLPTLVVLAAFFGGATQRWSQAIIILCFALLLIARPPRHSLGWVLNLAAFLFLALAACAFVPAEWFVLPQWRVALTNDFGVSLPGMVSAQPWMTLDSLSLLVAGLAWVYYLTGFDASLREVRLAARTFSAGIVALAALCLVLRYRHQALPFWHNEMGFGPFPNRNQTGDLFGITSILVLGCLQDDFRRGHKRWIFWIFGFGILLAAIILAYSRAGILILVIGCAAWLARFAFRKWSGPGVAISASLLLLLFAGLLLFGGDTIERFHLRLGSEGSVTSDYRWLIFRDAWTMIKASPWVGVGLGNFESVFALFRDVSRGVTRSLHPESDWIWVWAEMGWPALILLVGAGFVFVWRAFPLKEGSNQRLRYTALVGALLFALHGFVDVSGHRFASFLAGTFLLGISQARPVSRPSSRSLPILFRLVGLLLAMVSVAWFVAWRRALPLPGRIGVENARQTITIDNRGHRFAEAIAVADEGLKWAPLDWQLYFLRALSRLGQRQSLVEALADFRRARFLEPNAYQLPFEEGKAWLGWQPALAISAWREALQRQGAEEAGIYALMLSAAANYDEKTYAALRDLALEKPGLTIKYLDGATREQFDIAMKQILARDPRLELFSIEEKKRLFQLWSRHDPLDGLLQAVAAHPEWQEYAWPGMARDRAEHGDYAAAWRFIKRYGSAPTLPQVAATDESIEALEQKLYKNPYDFADGYTLYHTQLAAGKTDDALGTLRHFTAQPDSPAYFRYLEAQMWAAKQNWERAWRSWQDFADAGRKK